jgi:hypothetical protein
VEPTCNSIDLITDLHFVCTKMNKRRIKKLHQTHLIIKFVKLTCSPIYLMVIYTFYTEIDKKIFKRIIPNIFLFYILHWDRFVGSNDFLL